MKCSECDEDYPADFVCSRPGHYQAEVEKVIDERVELELLRLRSRGIRIEDYFVQTKVTEK